ncbi:MAG: preprotein translocase subunit SecE [Christensenellaceae bacterium]|nr:preprotein translocase subunit SecE [Christensenellaceae bacterium]
MAEEKKSAKTEQGKMAKFSAWCKALPARIAKPFKNMVAELKKVSWPSKKKLIYCSVTVLVFMLFMGVVIGLLDTGASALVKLLVR